ncbi:MAG: DNA helicase [Acidiphilium sp. 37-67-22]|nr:MAG: DNA helicase [Acidiphilium sp. 37-67-22]HQT72680.1 helicase-related protein [Acidiphilium sp.]
MSGFAPRVKAVLGPTNTGKTHLAIERLLAHSSGIIGFPLRLLARENYDRMVAVKGARHVALITGEEKIVPAEARWFSCTVEAMPLDRKVEFIAVDEIQLCADPDRGHVFTDRLLHARGMVETMFLGAETIRRLLRRLVPEAEIETRPRLSQLSHAGPAKLSRLPPRSAIVAFSAAEVYAIAEAVRTRRGGCAVVMGRLSPRTRNAQVALYQEKEVDFLVATDAIGMGLNMDVDHVAFAGLSKFDGHRPRLLTASEVAQIAGRAGRGMRDGTFGSTGTCPPLTEELVGAVEAHAFEPLEQLAWRNAELDFASPDALLGSLLAPPDRAGLVRGNDASDVLVLSALTHDPAIREAARGRRAVRLLWEACQIPDFRKLATDHHTRLCARVFTHLLREGVLPQDWVAGQIGGLGRTDGDIDTLMQRLTEVRIWAYIAARADWVRDAAHWQGRAREAEDLLSDALHEKLMARFVDRRAARLTRRLEQSETAELLSAVTRAGDVVVEGHPVGRIEGFRFEPDASVGGADKRIVLRAARRALASEMPRRVARLEAAADADFALGPAGAIAWQGTPIARLRRGATLLAPAVEVIDSEFLDGSQREAVRARLARFVDGVIAEGLAPLFAATKAAETDPALRGVLHRLAEQAGVLASGGAGGELRAKLRRIGVRDGAFALYMPALLKPRAAALRAMLWSAWHRRMLPDLPPPGLVSLPAPDWPAGLASYLGWVVAGPRAIRLDIAERLAGELRHAARRRPAPAPQMLASRLGVGHEDLPAVLRGLGLRLIPGEAMEPDMFGPPRPPMIELRRPRRGPPPLPRKAARLVPPPNPDHPFAVLAALRRVAS